MTRAQLTSLVYEAVNEGEEEKVRAWVQIANKANGFAKEVWVVAAGKRQAKAMKKLVQVGIYLELPGKDAQTCKLSGGGTGKQAEKKKAAMVVKEIQQRSKVEDGRSVNIYNLLPEVVDEPERMKPVYDAAGEFGAVESLNTRLEIERSGGSGRPRQAWAKVLWEDKESAEAAMEGDALALVLTEQEPAVTEGYVRAVWAEPLQAPSYKKALQRAEMPEMIEAGAEGGLHVALLGALSDLAVVEAMAKPVVDEVKKVGRSVTHCRKEVSTLKDEISLLKRASDEQTRLLKQMSEERREQQDWQRNTTQGAGMVMTQEQYTGGRSRMEQRQGAPDMHQEQAYSPVPYRGYGGGHEQRRGGKGSGKGGTDTGGKGARGGQVSKRRTHEDMEQQDEQEEYMEDDMVEEHELDRTGQAPARVRRRGMQEPQPEEILEYLQQNAGSGGKAVIEQAVKAMMGQRQQQQRQ
jgi:hypothetical protein